MAKRKPKLTPNQKEYNKQIRLLEKRIENWERTKQIRYTDIPERPKRITKKDIDRIKNIQYKNFSQEERDRYHKEYIDYYENDSIGPEHTDEPVKTEAEMDAWLDETFNQILNPSLIEREREGAKDILRNLLDTAKAELGVKPMYEYLQQPNVVDKLQTYASEYISSYQRKDGTDTGSTPLVKFAETLNLGRPLTQEQDEILTMYGTIDLDYTDTDYD